MGVNVMNNKVFIALTSTISVRSISPHLVLALLPPADKSNSTQAGNDTFTYDTVVGVANNNYYGGSPYYYLRFDLAWVTELYKSESRS